MNKFLIGILLFSSHLLFAQSKEELLVLLHDHSKINLVPMYGDYKIEKTNELKETDRKFVEEQGKLFGTKDSACILYNQAAWKHFYEGDLRAAMRRFNQAWLLDSNNASAYFGFSAILEVIKDNPNQYFETSTKIKNVEDPNKFYQIGTSKDRNNKYEIFSLKYTSTGFETYGRTDLALIANQKLLEIIPSDTSALKQSGYLHTINKNWEKVISDLNLAHQNGSNDSRLFNDIGYAYQEKGDYENAFINYEESASINPTNLNALYNNALLRLKLAQYDKALENIDKCISVKTDVGQFYKTKGEVLIKLNRKDEGVICLKKAKKLGDKDAGGILMENN